MQGLRDNPPYIRRIPPTLDHLRTYIQETAYIDLWKHGKHPRTLRGRVYWKMRSMAEAGNPPLVMRIVHLHPAADWGRLWDNLTKCWTTEAVKIIWYKVIHDILPTNERLHKIRLAETPLCASCGELDTIQHRVADCCEGARIWLWPKRRIAWILRIDPEHIPKE